MSDDTGVDLTYPISTSSRTDRTSSDIPSALMRVR